MTAPVAADWYPDPFNRHEHRFWDGAQWTHHVASSGSQSVDPPVAATTASTDSGSSAPAGWYPDPTGQSPTRYWDGTRWTEHIEADGHDGHGVHSAITPLPATRPANKKVERQARKVVSENVVSGGGPLFTEQVLVVNQNIRVVGDTMVYPVFDQLGRQLGTVEEVPRGIRAMANDSFFGRTSDTREYKFRIVDANRRTQLVVTRPPRWSSGKSHMTVEDSDGVPVGHIKQETHGLTGGMATTAHEALQNAGLLAGLGVGLVAGSAAGGAATKAAGKSVGWVAEKVAHATARDTTRAVFNLTGANDRIASAATGLDRIGHVRFGLEANGVRLATIQAETSAEWNFRIQDPAGAELGRITKTWSGWAKERFTKADHYVLELEQRLEDPLLSLITAAALAIDVACKEGDPSKDAAKAKRRLK